MVDHVDAGEFFEGVIYPAICEFVRTFTFGTSEVSALGLGADPTEAMLPNSR